ncbi:hypothetical protein K8R32_02895 [bacterium]|nr:hypothetical protein [bacterium]
MDYKLSNNLMINYLVSRPAYFTAIKAFRKSGKVGLWLRLLNGVPAMATNILIFRQYALIT